MNQQDKDFLLGKLDPNDEVSFKESFARARSSGHCAGLDYDRRPVLTGSGIRVINSFKNGIDVV